MSSFSRFQKINQSRGTANQKTNSSFILNGYPSIFITSTADKSIKIQASVVSKQEKSMAYIYTSTEDVLDAGSVWEAKSLHWLITEEIILIKDVNWRKYAAVLCNVEVNGSWGYFIGPEASYVNTVLKEDVLLQSQQKPLLVLANSNLKINDKIMIQGRAWQIQEEDCLTHPGVSYFSLTATTMSKDLNIEHSSVIDADADLPTLGEDDNVVWVDNMELIELETNDSFIVFSNPQVKLVKLSNNLATFLLPFGVHETLVKIKDSVGTIKEITYKVRVSE